MVGRRSFAQVLLGVGVAVLVAAAPRVGRAQLAYAAPVAPPNHLAVGDQYYDASVRGFRRYLETQRTANPALYAELDPELRGLEDRSKLAIIAGVAGGLGLVAGTVIPIAMIEDCDSASRFDAADPAALSAMEEDDACRERSMRRVLLGTGVGTGLVVAGLLGAVALRPGRAARLEFINHHNRLNPGAPAKLQLGFSAGPHLARAALTVAF